jgi:hypothetical protein
MKFIEVDLKAIEISQNPNGFTKEELIKALEDAKKRLKWFVCDALRHGLGRKVADYIADQICLAMAKEHVGGYGLMRWAVKNNPGKGLEIDDATADTGKCPPSALAYRKAWIDHMIKELQK